MQCPFSKYKNVLGKPNKGLHKYTFLNTAIIDYLLTILGACITSYLTTMPLPLTTIFWLTMGIVAHILFGVETSTLKYLGIKCS